MTAAAILDHLWQSSLVVVLAWGLARLLRRHRAELRFWMWFAASIKFLLPFALLVSAGVHSEWRLAGEGDVLHGSVGEWAVKLASPGSALTPVETRGLDFASAGWLVWALGSSLLLVRWFNRWRLVKRIAQMATPAALASPVPIRFSATLREPGVVGIIRPVIILPQDLAVRLQPAELEAILQHEVCHVRRHDNLWASLHMLVEAVFWFNPLVWWLGRRLVDERERACDEAVLESGANPRSYAQGIFKVCQFYMASQLACVSGVSGANLKFRLEGIMKNEKAIELNPGRKWLCAAVALGTLAAPVIAGMAATTAGTPTPASAPAKATAAGKIVLLPDRRVKLDYANVEVRSLLQALAQAASVNMLVSDQVTGSVTVRLDAMPWEQALDIVLASQGLGRHESAGIIIVEPLTATR